MDPLVYQIRGEINILKIFDVSLSVFLPSDHPQHVWQSGILSRSHLTAVCMYNCTYTSLNGLSWFVYVAMICEPHAHFYFLFRTQAFSLRCIKITLLCMRC